MNTVKIITADLFKRLEANRHQHRESYLKAEQGYRALVIQKMDANLQAARDGGPVETVIDLRSPEDHTADYDLVIEMLKMSVDESVTLSAADFQRYAMDNWQWSHSTKVLHDTYAAAAIPIGRNR